MRMYFCISDASDEDDNDIILQTEVLSLFLSPLPVCASVCFSHPQHDKQAGGFITRKSDQTSPFRRKYFLMYLYYLFQVLTHLKKYNNTFHERKKNTV